MSDKRKKDVEWKLSDNADGTIPVSYAQIAVLMDLRDELKKLNRLLSCENFTSIPALLRMIRENTAKPKRKRKPVKRRTDA